MNEKLSLEQIVKGSSARLLLNILESAGLSEGEIMRIGATLAVHDAMITSAMEGEENAIEFCKSGLKDAEAVGMPWLELGKSEKQAS